MSTYTELIVVGVYVCINACMNVYVCMCVYVYVYVRMKFQILSSMSAEKICTF